MTLRTKLLTATLVGILLFATAMLAGGAGHGTNIPLFVLFPFPSILVAGVYEEMAWLGLVQFPVYVLLSSVFRQQRARQLAVIVLVVIHFAAALYLLRAQEFN
jgi:hypothetical protein